MLRPRGPVTAVAALEIVWVQEANWNTVAVFLACTWSLASGGLAPPQEYAIAAQEILAACLLLRIPRREWAGITEGIARRMVPAYLDELKQFRSRTKP